MTDALGQRLADVTDGRAVMPAARPPAPTPAPATTRPLDHLPAGTVRALAETMLAEGAEVELVDRVVTRIVWGTP